MNLTLKEKFLGSFYGGAIGDALGLGSEFMSAAEARRRYPNGLHYYSEIIRDAHRSQWDRGDWTNDTEVLIMMMESIIECGGIDVKHFAWALRKWFETNPVDVVPQVRWVVSEPDYLDDPIGVADRVWKRMGRHNASNEALQRAILCGAWEHDDIDGCISLVCRITHPDTRCVGAATVLAHVAHDIIYHDRIPSRQEMMEIAERIDPRVCPYIELAESQNIADLELDDPDKLWYVRKCMAFALLALWHTSSPEEALDAVIMAAGDADTNGAVTMNLVGLRDGIDAIPHILIDGLLQRDRLMDVASRFLPVLEKHVAEVNG